MGDINPPPDDPIVMVPCDDCGRMVPQMNLTIHKLRACQGRARLSSTTETLDDSAIPMEIDDPPTSWTPTLESPPRRDGNRVVPSTEYETPPNGSRIRRRRMLSKRLRNNDGSNREIEIDDDQVPHSGQVVDLVDSSDSSQPSSENSTDNTNADEWACPKCTLLNSNQEPVCAACHYRNPDIERAPDPVRTERLIDGTPGPATPLMYVSSGALLGGVLGAAGSFMQGRNLFSGVAEGAMGGAVGGAFLNEVLRNPVANQAGTAGANAPYNANNIAQARSSAAMGMAGYPSMTSDLGLPNSGAGRMQPRSSYRVVQQRSGNGVTTIITGGNGTTQLHRTIQGSGFPAGINDPVFNLILHSLMQQGASTTGGNMNTDGWDYEQLLRAFGDGTENLGADEREISQLPSSIVQNPEKELPEEARQCLICLEEFQSGESRKCLPCLHGFHEACADKWLRNNGSCPICKHRITS